MRTGQMYRDGLTLNRVLHPDEYKGHHFYHWEGLVKMCDPALWERKIPGARFQYLHLTQQILRTQGRADRKVLVVGAYEDPIVPFLQKNGGEDGWFQIDVCDPMINGKTLCEFLKDSLHDVYGYDLVVSASVLEHVKDDIDFMLDIYIALKPGGVALLTCDFKDSWRPGDPLAPTEERLYTNESLMKLTGILDGRVEWLGERDFSPVGDYFGYMGVEYAFAAIGFRKL